MSQPLRFPSLTASQFNTLRAAAAAQGITMNGPSGTAGQMGVEVRWNYDDAAQLLELECLKAPFFMSKGDVENRLTQMVRKILG